MNIKKTSAIGAIAAGVAGLTAAAVGAYYLYGHKDASKNRAKVKGWMLKAKGDVLEQLESAKEVTEDAYMGALASVAKKYHDLKTIDPAELEAFIYEMRDHWSGIKESIEKATAPKKPRAKKPAKKGKKSKK